jgi:uncharacterized damage-inducible protein DinB
MQTMIADHAAYNQWANDVLLKVVKTLDATKQQKEIISSFPSVYSPLLHILSAETIRWQRMHNEPQTARTLKDAGLSCEAILDGILRQDKWGAEWVTTLQTEQLQSMTDYKTSKQEYFEQPLWEILMHLFNHSTYHRGQLVTMLRQLGITQLPGTDVLLWYRNK